MGAYAGATSWLKLSPNTCEMTQENLKYNIAFSLAKGMIGDTAKELLRRLGSPQALFSYSESQLQSLTGVNSEIFNDTYRAEILQQAQRESVFVESNNIRASFIGEEGYPQRLIDCQDAPALIYQLGAANLDSPYVVGIVGTRHATPYGIDFTKRLVSDLAAMFPGIIIVSGLAFGIDIAAHKAAMEAGTPTVAVVAHGLDTIYPAEHRQAAAQIINSGGALITEYASGYRIRRQSFLARNRIVAGVSDCLVVIESDIRGGSMSTARLARDYNRDVFALPGRTNDMYSRGTNMLIATDRARLITNAKDIANAMMWTPQDLPETSQNPTLFRALTTEEQLIYDFILKHPDATENDMCVNLGLPFSKVTNIIFSLEMEDFITKVPGGKYMPTAK